MAEGLDTAEKAGELWVEEHNVTSSGSLKRPKSKEEKRLLRKMDLAIVPLLTLTFFIAYLVFPHFMEIAFDTDGTTTRIETIWAMHV
jgi:hypothetical protein